MRLQARNTVRVEAYCVLAQQRCGRLGDRTGFAAERDRLDASVDDLQFDMQRIAAKRIRPIGYVRRRGQRAEMAQRTAVFEDEALIKLAGGHTLIVRRRAARSAYRAACEQRRGKHKHGEQTEQPRRCILCARHAARRSQTGAVGDQARERRAERHRI